MAVYILEPWLADDFIIAVFTNLVQWEVKKVIGLDVELQEGCQTGYIACLADLFGEASDDEVNLAFDNGETWLQVVDTIMKENKLVHLIEAKTNRLSDSGGLDIYDFDNIRNTCYIVVNEFISTYMDVARKTIHNV